MPRPYIRANWPITQGRGPHTLWKYPYLNTLYKRQQLVGPDLERHRSDFIWNYEAELFSYSSFWKAEQKRVRDLIEIYTEDNKESEDNFELSKRGRHILHEHMTNLHKSWYPKLHKSCLNKIIDYYMSNSFNANVAERLGFRNLTRAESSMDDCIARSLFAYIGAIEYSADLKRAHKFINDIYTHLYIDINELFHFEDPFKFLEKLTNKNLEVRLLWSTGTSTMLSCYVIGIYTTDKVLLGRSPGQSLNEAIYMAACDAIRSIFSSEECRAPIQDIEEGNICFPLKTIV